MPLKPIVVTCPEKITEDTSMDEEYWVQYLNSLPEDERRLIGIHHLDQWEAVQTFVARYRDNPGLIEQEDNA